MDKLTDSTFLTPPFSPSYSFSPPSFQTLFAVFDGHGGDYTSRFLERNFAPTFQSLLLSTSSSSPHGTTGENTNDVHSIESALRDACLTLNERLARDPRMSVVVPPPPPKDDEEVDTKEGGGGEGFSAKGLSRRRAMDGSGACGVIAVVTSTHVVVANVGDCRCVLRRRGGALEKLTRDHDCRRVDERTRVEESGGFVDEVTFRIHSRKGSTDSLAPSRAWGDFNMTKFGIISVPEMTTIERDPEGEEVLLLGCDGVFETMTADKVVSIVMEEATSIERTIQSTIKMEKEKDEVEGEGEGEGEGEEGEEKEEKEEKMPPGTPKSRVSRVTARPTEEELCRELNIACENVMLQSLERQCSDNQTICLALLRTAGLKHV